MGLQAVLKLVVSGGSGAVVFWAMEHVPFLEKLSAEHKRYASLGLSVGLPVVGWLLMVAMGYEAAPERWQGWVEQAFALATGAILVSQGAHGALRLRERA